MHADLQSMINEMGTTIKSSHSESSFNRLFWEQQVQAANTQDSRNMRWHSMMIRWCLYMKSKSTTAYEALRKVITLPSSRTLRYYTHVYKAKLGFQVEVDKQLCQEFQIDEIPEWKKYVGIVFDEMKVKEGIIYDKHECHIIGYVNLDDISNKLLHFEQICNDDCQNKDYVPPVATHINCFMVCGIFVHLNFSYAQFATASASSDELFPIVWGTFQRPELLSLKVIFITCDGAAANRKFFNMHAKKGEFVHMIRNIYSTED